MYVVPYWPTQGHKQQTLISRLRLLKQNWTRSLHKPRRSCKQDRKTIQPSRLFGYCNIVGHGAFAVTIHQRMLGILDILLGKICILTWTSQPSRITWTKCSRARLKSHTHRKATYVNANIAGYRWTSHLWIYSFLPTVGPWQLPSIYKKIDTSSYKLNAAPRAIL